MNTDGLTREAIASVIGFQILAEIAASLSISGVAKRSSSRGDKPPAKNEMARGEVNYNYTLQTFPDEEGPGIGIFCRDAGGVFHTYSTYGRGVEDLGTVWTLRDLTPDGLQEDWGNSPEGWW